MSSHKLYKVSRTTVFVDKRGEEHVLIEHTITAGGSSRSEAIEAGKEVMYPQVDTNWDATELTDTEYSDYYNEIYGVPTVTGRLHR